MNEECSDLEVAGKFARLIHATAHREWFPYSFRVELSKAPHRILQCSDGNVDEDVLGGSVSAYWLCEGGTASRIDVGVTHEFDSVCSQSPRVKFLRVDDHVLISEVYPETWQIRRRTTISELLQAQYWDDIPVLWAYDITRAGLIIGGPKLASHLAGLGIEQ